MRNCFKWQFITINIHLSFAHFAILNITKVFQLLLFLFLLYLIFIYFYFCYTLGPNHKFNFQLKQNPNIGSQSSNIYVRFLKSMFGSNDVNVSCKINFIMLG